MRSADETGLDLSLLVLSLPVCSRPASHALFEFAEGLERWFVFGLLANGDFAIALPGLGYERAAAIRHDLLHRLQEHRPTVTLAVYDGEVTAQQLIQSASTDSRPSANVIPFVRKR
jgi:hypothetical protein